MWFGHHGMGWMMGGFWWIFPLFFIICIIMMLFMLFGRRSQGTFHSACGTHYSGDNGREADTAFEILKKRYARGEITKEEFERLKRDIGN